MSNGVVGSQRGQILPVFCLMLALLLLPVTALAVDGGLLLSSHAALVGAVQAAAEAGSQSVDVTALDDHGAFELCSVPDGGPNCGNGVGTVGEVVSNVISAIYPTAALNCTEAEGSQPPSHLPGPSGCAFVVLPACSSSASGGSAVANSRQGVEVVSWETVQLPVLAFPGWSSVKLRASASAWLEHGFGYNSAQVGAAATPC